MDGGDGVGIATIRAPMSPPSSLTTPVGRFADHLLERDLPELEAGRRLDTVRFIERRVDGLPSFTRFGVVVIGQLIDLVRRVAGARRSVDLAIGVRIPLLSEYPRLVRSLGYSYIWETWPDTDIDGSAR